MRIKKRWVKLSFLVVLFFIFYFFRKPVSEKSPPASIPSPKVEVATDSAKVLRVIDGDTVELENKQRVRYIGIDAPELHHPTKPVGCFAQQAYELNKSLVEGKTVILERDVTDTDRYGRLLRYVYLPPDQKETTHSGFFINDYLVRQGYAVMSTFPPDVKYVDQFIRAQTEAREKNKGLWKACR